MAIFIFDFDHTIVNGHTHNILAQFFAPTNKTWSQQEIAQQWKLVKDIPPIKSGKDWKKLFEDLIKNNHQVAVASFSSYKPIIAKYLQETLNLDDATRQQIFIEAWLPDDPASANKNQHIANVLKHFQFVGNNKEIIFIDDSYINTESAETAGYTVVRAHDEMGRPFRHAEHFEAVLRLINTL